MDEATLESCVKASTTEQTDPAFLLESLLQRADALLDEFKAYQAYLQANNASKDVEARIFRRGVESEVKSLHTITNNIANLSQNGAADLHGDEQQSKRLHALRSSNLPFYEAIWQTAKGCRGIRSLGKRVYWREAGTPKNHSGGSGRCAGKSALVDLVSDDGLQWVKVSIVTEKRLLFEMAKEGWEDYGDESDYEYSTGDEVHSDQIHKTSKLELVRLAEQLRDAAHSIRVQYGRPQVRFVLPRLIEGSQKEVDAMLAGIRATGVIVECGERPPDNATSLNSIFERMLPSSHLPLLTATLNIDCTILLALISDISHLPRAQLPPSPTSKSGTYHTAIMKQIESEERAPLLPNEIHPALHGRTLVCTRQAAQRMREIVNTMGTASERRRADVILGEGEYAGVQRDALRDALAHLSTHAISDDLRLPIEDVDFDFSPASAACFTPAAFLSAVASKLTAAMNLSPINASVFMYGWQQDIVTITSNRLVAVGIERNLNGILDEEERHGKAMENFEGPKLWVCDTARSLVGKDKVNGLRP